MSLLVIYNKITGQLRDDDRKELMSILQRIQHGKREESKNFFRNKLRVEAVCQQSEHLNDGEGVKSLLNNPRNSGVWMLSHAFSCFLEHRNL